MVNLLNKNYSQPFFFFLSDFTAAYENLQIGIFKQQTEKKTPLFLHLCRSGMPCFPYMTNLRLDKSDTPNFEFKASQYLSA